MIVAQWDSRQVKTSLLKARRHALVRGLRGFRAQRLRRGPSLPASPRAERRGRPRRRPPVCGVRCCTGQPLALACYEQAADGDLEYVRYERSVFRIGSIEPPGYCRKSSRGILVSGWPDRNVSEHGDRILIARKCRIGMSSAKLKFHANHNTEMVRLPCSPSFYGWTGRSWLYGCIMGFPKIGPSGRVGAAGCAPG